MPNRSACGRDFPEALLRCGSAEGLLPGARERDPTLKELGACPDRGEVYEAEEDYWGAENYETFYPVEAP